MRRFAAEMNIVKRRLAGPMSLEGPSATARSPWSWSRTASARVCTNTGLTASPASPGLSPS